MAQAMATAAGTSSNVADTVERTIAHFDADHFECQVYLEMPEYAHLRGQPFVVANSQGVITSVSPAAKALGVDKTKKTGQTAQQIQAKHPQVFIITKENRLGKPDSRPAMETLLAMRDAAEQIQGMLGAELITLEFPLKDEFFMDITALVNKKLAEKTIPTWHNLEKSHIWLEGLDQYHAESMKYRLDRIYNNRYGLISDEIRQELRLVHGGIVARQVVEGMDCMTDIKLSAGIGVNKLMAKIATGLHKPNGITALTHDGLTRLSCQLPIEKINGLGSDKGRNLNRDHRFRHPNNSMTIEYLRNRVEQFSFRKHYGEEYTNWLHDSAWGICSDPVRQQTRDKKITDGKTFGKDGYRGTWSEIFKRVENLAKGLVEKLIHQGLQIEKRIAETAVFYLEYKEPGKPRVTRRSVTVETGAMDIPLAQYQDVDTFSMAEEAMGKMEEKGIDFENIAVMAMKFYAVFDDDDFIDEENEQNLIDFITGKRETFY